jgi:hypothetical protein
VESTKQDLEQQSQQRELENQFLKKRKRFYKTTLSRVEEDRADDDAIIDELSSESRS